MYHYYAFGLNIESEIECPLLIEGDGSAPDLVVRLGQVPHELEQVQESTSWYQISAGRFLLKVDQVARYLVSDGREIMVERHPLADDKDVRLFLLGSAMGALLHQRGVWPIHGSAVSTEHGAVLFVGDKGSGKSTLAGAFNQRGFQVLSDDVCAITVGDDGAAQVWPAYPRISLWADSVTKLGSEPSQLTRTDSFQEKYVLPMQHFSRDAELIQAVYALSRSEDQESVQLTTLKGFDKVRELTTNTYRLHFLSGMQLASQHFTQAQALAKQARVVRIARPTRPFLLDELADTILRDFDK
ncbi:MAG: hypothetical protein JSW55_12980 [Chloroflexota bacterium]|nr:MAG: hypothetical protein JSW55_12980 [Chloroflexota bacterium]